MKVIKNINTNVALCIDDNGNELVAFGKGIGYGKMPYELTDLSIVERTYYGVSQQFLSLINDLDEDVIAIADQTIRYAREKLDNPISSNIIFSLADHISFCIKRYQENMSIKLPIVNEIQDLFDKEMEIGKYCLSLIKQKLNIQLPKMEAAYIALHIINSEASSSKKTVKSDEETIEDITAIIEKEFAIKIDRDNFNYSRFLSHMHYLLKRGKSNEIIQTGNEVLYQKMVEQFPKAHVVSELIYIYLIDNIRLRLTDEEKLYLMLHINRLCSRQEN